MRREVWHGRPVGAWGGTVVQDDDDVLVLYMPEGSPLAMTDDFFGAPHPWSGRDRWSGPGVLQLQRPGEAYAVWHGQGADFRGWYVNFQAPFRRSPLGFDTLGRDVGRLGAGSRLADARAARRLGPDVAPRSPVRRGHLRPAALGATILTCRSNTDSMRLTSKGQVTIPIAIRERLGLRPGAEVEFGIEDDAVTIRRLRAGRGRGRQLVERMRGRATAALTTDEIMALTRE